MNFFGIGPLEAALVIAVAIIFLRPDEIERPFRALGAAFRNRLGGRR